MTKPTGRPRGRPKTKEYSTLMARVPQELVERVKQYAARHRSPISDLIRDGLEWRLQEEDKILAYRYVPMTYSVDEIVADINGDGSENNMSDAKEALAAPLQEPSIVSDVKIIASDYNMSDIKEEPEPSPDFDRAKYRLANPCKHGHASHGSQNLRTLIGSICVECDAVKKAAKQTQRAKAARVLEGAATGVGGSREEHRHDEL